MSWRSGVRTSLLYGGAEPSKHELAASDPAFTFFTSEIRSPVPGPAQVS